MPAAISTHGLTKYYGKTPGIVDLDLTVNTGEVFGFLGPNGAGKSTKIRVLLDRLSIGHKAHSKTNSLSQGERQRAAIARALVNDPVIILADDLGWQDVGFAGAQFF